MCGNKCIVFRGEITSFTLHLSTLFYNHHYRSYGMTHRRQHPLIDMDITMAHLGMTWNCVTGQNFSISENIQRPETGRILFWGMFVCFFFDKPKISCFILPLSYWPCGWKIICGNFKQSIYWLVSHSHSLALTNNSNKFTNGVLFNFQNDC